jgi:hypothetical protein
MKKIQWITFMAALGLIVATAAYLGSVKNTLGKPGVRVGPVSVFDPDGKLVSTNSVVLPDQIQGARAVRMPITKMELEGLPRDTTFGRSIYHFADNSEAQISVVLMGTDRTSIHQPQFCLVGQGWSIIGTDRINVRMDRPFAYDVPAMKLTTAIRVKGPHGRPQTIHGVYIYWFVSGNNITADQGTRLWSIARTRVEKGYLERWAYISYFSTCLPGQEDAASQRLENLMKVSVPEFQTVTGSPSGRISALASEK